MKKAYIIAGIIIAVACVISLLYGAINQHGYHNIYDGSPSLYERLHRRGIVFLTVGAVLAVLAAASFVLGAHASVGTGAQTGDMPLSVDKLISYKLPSEFELQSEYPYEGEEGNPIVEKSYVSEENGCISVGILSYKGKDLLGDSQVINLDEKVNSLDKKKEIRVDGETGYFGTRESDDMPDMSAVVYVSHGDFVFEFRLTNSDEQVTAEQTEEFERIVSSSEFKGE